MRRTVCAAVLASAVIGMIMTGCDLLNHEVLIDEGEKITVIDSTRVRVLSNTADSTNLVIVSNAEWEAVLTDGEGWCTISKYQGRKGTDTIRIFVQENPSTVQRKALLAVVSGPLTKIYWVVQGAAEEWIEVMYWDRTALQRAGLHGKVDSMTVSDSWHPGSQTGYFFDIRGNVLRETTIENDVRTAFRQYQYDSYNHKLSCTVKDFNDNVIRTWEFEYENKGRYVPYSAQGWMDQDPLGEDMEGRIVPDMSASHKTWIYGGFEYHDDRVYTFSEDYKLVIYVDRWKDSLGTRVPVLCDTMKVEYQYSSGKMLPQKGIGYVNNTFYYSNGMIYMMTTKYDEYKFLENPVKMVVEKYSYTGSAGHDIDYYECDYNANHDLVEKRTKHNGAVDVDVDRYPQYQYDNKNNWILMHQETSEHEKYYQRTITYYK